MRLDELNPMVKATSLYYGCVKSYLMKTTYDKGQRSEVTDTLLSITLEWMEIEM